MSAHLLSHLIPLLLTAPALPGVPPTTGSADLEPPAPLVGT